MIELRHRLASPKRAATARLRRPLLGMILKVCVALFAPACTSTLGQPKALDQLYAAYEKDRVARYQSLISSPEIAAAASSATVRNEVMNDLILMIDHRYGDIERSLYGHKSWADFGGSVLATGLGTAGTLAGGVGVKTTLSALVTAIDSTKVSFSKDILQGQGIIAIIATMRKTRAEKLLQIRYSQKLSASGYPLSLGLDDLMEYYQAGTFVAALQAMTEDAAAGKKLADAQLTAIKTRGTIPVKTLAAHPAGVIPAAESGPPAGLPKTQPTHPAGLIEPAQ